MMADQENETSPFPVDWNEWQSAWERWRYKHRHDLQNTSARFAGKNFMADARLGTYSVRGVVVELSEVTFPDLSAPAFSSARKRYIGITRGIGSDSDSALVSSFAELDQELGL